jgi:ankyrin repeat protein
VVVGGTPLLAAVAGRQRVIAELLLAKGADVRVRLPRGATLLNLAAVQGDVETMKLLLARGLDVAARDERGTTPLALALTAEQEEAAALLRARGAKE